MTNQKTERSIQFLLEHQAQLDTNFNQLKESQANLQSQIEIHNQTVKEAIIKLAEAMGNLANFVAKVGEMQDQISSKQLQIYEKISELNDIINNTFSENSLV